MINIHGKHKGGVDRVSHADQSVPFFATVGALSLPSLRQYLN
jgi:hypothetical protein